MNNIKDQFNEKEIFELLNDVNIDECEYDNIDFEINELQKKRLKRNLKKKIKSKKYKYGVSAAAVVLVCIIAGGFANPTFAQNIPVLGSIIESVNNKSGFHGEYSKYSQTIDKSVSDKGITVTINEVVCDDNTLNIGYTIKGDKKIKELLPDKNMTVPHFLEFSIKVNGSDLDINGGGKGDYLDEYNYVGTEEINIGDKHIPSNFSFDLSIVNLGGIEGDWSFKFNISKDQISQKTTNFKPNVKIDLINDSIKINKVSFSPINTSIIYDGKYKKNKEKRMEEYDWIVFDDKGVELSTKGASCRSADIRIFSDFVGQKHFEALNEIPKYLTVIPYKRDKDIKPEKQAIDLFKSTYPIELSQGKIGKLIIKEVKTAENKTIINYIAEGIAPYLQGSCLSLHDENGKCIEASNIFNIRKDINKPTEYTLEYDNLDNNKRYNLITQNLDYYEIREDLKFKIPLEN